MTGDIKLEITITAEAVQAIFSLLGLTEKREESTKEESKEKVTDSSSLNPSTDKVADLSDTAYIHTASASNNNYINNNSFNDAVDVAIQPSNSHVANPPSMGEVKEYIEEKKYDVNPYRFFTYYSKRGWKDKNGNDIRESWKETIDYWMHNGVSNNNMPNTSKLQKEIPPVDKESREALKATHPFVPTEF